jgi:hypothetical protein
MNERPPSWRKLTEAEKRVLDRLVAGEFAGKAELIAQIEQATVSRIDREGSLQFRTTGPNAPVAQRVPVEGSYPDGTSDPLGPAFISFSMLSAGAWKSLKSTGTTAAKSSLARSRFLWSRSRSGRSNGSRFKGLYVTTAVTLNGRLPL